MIETRITQLFGIEHPIICGCMQNLTRAEFVATVSNAGALGILNSLACPTVEALRYEIRRTKDLTDRPFAVNFTLLPTLRPVNIEAYIDAAIEEGAPIIETAGRSPKPYLERIKQGNVKFMHKCGRVRDAVSVARAGADAVTIVGFENGGHPAEDDVTTLILVPLAAKAISVPLIAGGGFGDGRGLMAALALGAEGVLMGTRFLATKECPANEKVKEWMLQASESDTAVIMRTLHNNMRVMKNAASAKMLELEARGAPLEELLPVVSGERGREAMLQGRLDAGVITCGQVVGLITEIPTVQEMLTTIIREAEEVLDRLGKLSPRGART